MAKRVENVFVPEFEREVRALERAGVAGRRMREAALENAGRVRHAHAELLVAVMKQAANVSLEQERRAPPPPPPPPSPEPEPLTAREKLAVALARKKETTRVEPEPEVISKHHVFSFVKSRALSMLKDAHEGEPGHALMAEICRRTGVQAHELPSGGGPPPEDDLAERIARLERPDPEFDSDELMERKIEAVKELSHQWRSRLVAYGPTPKDHHRIGVLIKQSDAKTLTVVEEIQALKERAQSEVDYSQLINIVYSSHHLKEP